MDTSTIRLEPISTNSTKYPTLMFSGELLDLTVRQVLTSRSVGFLGVSASPHDPGELIHACVVGAAAGGVTPFGECLRLNVDALDGAPLCPDLLLAKLQRNAKLFPSSGKIAGVIELPTQGFVILLPAIGQNNDVI